MIKTLVLAAGLALSTGAAQAKVTFDPVTSSVVISGATTSWQVNSVYEVFKDNEVLTVVLSGNGGEFYSGLSLGRLIAEEGSAVVIPEGTTCVSSCAFAALAGERVIVKGELWFHPPYLQAIPTNVTTIEVAQMFGRAYVDMARYLIEMGIPVTFGHDLLVRSDPWNFVVIDDGLQIDRLKSTEVPWGPAIYEYRYNKLGE